jgi:membrane protein YqaA with SNARE-associated domain
MLSPQIAPFPVAAAAALGQMTAKSLLYLAGRGLLRLPFQRTSDRIRKATARLAGAEGGAMTLVLVSALTGIPPFYGMSLAAGVLRLRFGRFLCVGCGGRFLRFAAVFALPRLWA